MRRNRGRTVRAWAQALLALPAAVYFVAWVFFPILYGLWVSFTNDSLVAPPRFVGAANYRTVLTDPNVWQSAERTLAYASLAVIPTLAAGLFLALLLNTVGRGRVYYQLALFLPNAIPSVAAALVWSLILQPSGLLNGIFGLNVAWLAGSKTAMVALGLVTAWGTAGYYSIIFLAGLQNIPSDLAEAARLDGAGSWQVVRYVVLPLLRPTVLFASVTATAGAITNFTLPYAMTDGGPGFATTTVPLLIYNEAFQYGSAGVASAIAVLLLVVTVLLTYAQFRLLRGGAYA